MPIHLPPISRRRFLAGALAAGTGLVLPRGVWAEPPKADPNRWILISDTHIWEDRNQERHGVKPADNFLEARQEILALKNRPAGVLLSGDCVFLKGHTADYAVLVELVKPIREAGLPLHFALGNHDHRENFLQSVPEVKAADVGDVPEKYVSVVETPLANWFLLDSLLKTDFTPGTLGKAQLAWLAKTLDARPDKPALIVAHHDPDIGTNVTGLADTVALFDVLSPRKQVKAYVFGHTHRWQVSALNGIHLVNVPTLAWLFDAKQPRGWIDAQLRADGITLQLNALDKSHPKNGQKVELAWRT